MGGKLKLLEFGRGIAAFAVVICHVHWYLIETPDYIHFLWPWGSWAVDFFFVLSWFIIYHVNGHELGSGKPLVFLRRRFYRIVPTYWLILTGALLIRQFLGNPSHVLHLTPMYLLTNYLLLPSSNLLINPAWSLRHELLFYAVFSIAIYSLRIGILLAVVWLAAIISSRLLSYGGELPLDVITNSRNLYFGMGMCIAILVSRLNLASLLKGGPPLSIWLGQISYSLYLCHIPSFLIVHGILKRTAPQLEWYWVATLGIAFSVIVAVLISSMFESKFLRWANGRARRRPLVASSSPTRGAGADSF
ncbi:acyltransferase family protein [Bradyrhizobium sp. HKCCYLRH3099]|uniref:acyltransferase family protein n=1 Tax=unclassified Bradyrhizobium TaxID=2631580 RepID=UPI003EBCE968